MSATGDLRAGSGYEHVGIGGRDDLVRWTIERLARRVAATGALGWRHAVDVAQLAVELGVELGLGDRRLDCVRLGGLLHDVGKLELPEAVLAKRGPLDAEEWRLVRGHSAAGERLLALLLPFPGPAAVARSHHERWDGAGYPDGLAGTQIPLTARIVAVADAFRAMLEDRPYRRALGLSRSCAELREHAGSQFDPACVDALWRVVGRTRRPRGRALPGGPALSAPGPY